MIIFSILSAIGNVKHSNSEKEEELMRRIKAEDILQEVFVKNWEKTHTFDENRCNAYGWIITLTRHTAIERIRSKEYKTQEKISRIVNQPECNLEGDKQNPLETTIFSDLAELLQNTLSKYLKAEVRFSRLLIRRE